MEKQSQELGELIADLKLIKEAVSKSDGILRFIDTGGAMRSVLLLSGLLIALFSGLFYSLIANYGSLSAVPLNIRIALYLLIGFAWCTTGFLKIRNFMKGARGVSEDMTLNRFFCEIYSSRLMATMLPFLLVIVMIIIFLGRMGHLIYIVPVLSILIGLLFISMNPILYLKELYFLSIWLIATGILTLYTATTFHPTVALGLTFSAGFILASLLLYLEVPGNKSKEVNR